MKDIATQLLEKYEGVISQSGFFDKYSMLSELETGVYLVEFTKVDGENTIMEATLMPSMLPPQKEGTTPRPAQDHLLHVYSPDRKGWRSFTVANVKSFTRKT